MDDQTSQPFGKLVHQALTSATASQGPATKPSTTSDEHRRAFVQTFRRWSVLFKRKDGDVEADKWLMAEYYKSLGHLSAHQLDLLTDELKKTCVFFPAIAECLTIINPPRYSYGSPFYTSVTRGPDAIGSVEWYGGEQPKRIAQ